MVSKIENSSEESDILDETWDIKPNCNGGCKAFGEECKGFHHKLKVFYQSLEFPNAPFSKALAEFFNQELKEEPVFACEKDREKLEYHNQVKQLLSLYIDHLKTDCLPDIIALGEYTPLKEEQRLNNLFFQKKVVYKLGGYVNIIPESSDAKDGKRGMTILYREDSNQWDRISIHQNNSKNICDCWRTYHGEVVSFENLIKGIMDKLDLSEQKAKERYEKGREVMISRWQEMIGHEKNGLKACAEIMFRNRYLCIAHVPQVGSHARERARESMEQLSHFRLMGDCNFDLTGQATSHTLEKKLSDSCRIMQVNTDYRNISKNIESSFLKMQNELNLKGSTVKCPKNDSNQFRAHDGVYNYLSDKTANVEILGSYWPIIPEEDDQYSIISDHKGFLLELVTNSSTDSDTSSVTSNESVKLSESKSNT